MRERCDISIIDRKLVDDARLLAFSGPWGPITQPSPACGTSVSFLGTHPNHI
ncbi:hypothetical protein M405DRAFT_805061 [Rhizopogon salebrosus TDB-379]|nr:hypothetical protein M405DRAFT_805061 [Rhizopogon salebrosus TDB-379]